MPSFPTSSSSAAPDSETGERGGRFEASGHARTLSRPQLLAVDDDASALEVIGGLASQLGFDMETCASGRAALGVMARRPIGLALIGLGMPDREGLDLLDEIRSRSFGCDVVLMGSSEAGRPVDAIKRGAREYITTPFDPERLRSVLNHFCQEGRARAHMFALDGQIAEQTEYRGMIGRSPAMQNVFHTIERLAPHATHVLVSGETGTGKELVAQAFHQAGPRSAHPIVMVNGSTLAGARLDGEFEAAHQGTLVLDEIGELSAEAQGGLLRLLESGSTGIPDTRRTDVAIVAVTSRDLRADVASGRFDADLLARLNAVEVMVPPLRDHLEDIPYLVATFVRECEHQLDKSFDGLTPLAERLLLGARWDGNVRELKHLIERACMLVDSRVISDRELTGVPSHPDSRSAARHGAPGSVGTLGLRSDEPHAESGQLERELIVDTLRQLGGNRMATAKALGISRRSLYRRLERHHITHRAPRHRSGHRRGAETTP